MLLEYIVKKDNKDEFIKRLDEFNPECKQLSDDSFFISVSQNGNSEQSAKKLSDLNDKVTDLKPIVLTNGSAAYFNKMLFPLVNNFERKLRKLLYASSAISQNKKDTIANLEELDFGEIFELLFLDREYWIRVKTFVNGSKNGDGWKGYSSELINFLSSENENLLWDRLLPGQVPTLRKRFNDIRNKRNDIMHAHNISRSVYTETRTLFKNVNTEIDESIKKIANGVLIPSNFNEELDGAFGYFRLYDGTLEISSDEISANKETLE